MAHTGAVLLIASGLRAPRLGAEWVLKHRSFQAVARWSYSIYLWHYPILILAAQRFGPLTVPENVLLVGAAILLSAATYRLVEDPIRLSTYVKRSAWLGIGIGLLVVALVVAMLSAFI
jgi:peptidoglycan/LPS O-acetylase OafA/YrhL